MMMKPKAKACINTLNLYPMVYGSLIDVKIHASSRYFHAICAKSNRFLMLLYASVISLVTRRLTPQPY